MCTWSFMVSVQYELNYYYYYYYYDKELFVFGTFLVRWNRFVMWFFFSTLPWSLIQHSGQHNVFCVVDSNFFFNHLFTVKYSFSSVHQRIRNDFRQSLVSKDARKATQCSQPYKQRRFQTSPSRTSVWWDNFVKEVFVTEEGRENFQMSRRNLLKLSKLLRPHIEGKTTRMRCPVDVTKKVACTLYYLSDKGRLRKTANAFGFSCQVVSKIIREVCRAVTVHLGSEYLKLPQQLQRWKI